MKATAYWFAMALVLFIAYESGQEFEAGNIERAIYRSLGIIQVLLWFIATALLNKE